MSVRWLTMGVAWVGLSAVAMGQAPPSVRNLLPNSSFEDITDGMPDGWTWSAGAARAEMQKS